jgi:hypothetical protein
MKFIECIIGSGFFFSSVFIMMHDKNNKIFTDFDKLLTSKQKKNYNEIKQERLNIYINGTLLSILFALLVIKYININPKNKANTFIILSSMFNYAFYTLHPKSTYMILNLNTEEQRQAWLNIYLEMKKRCIMGFVIGVIANIFFGLGLCDK